MIKYNGNIADITLMIKHLMLETENPSLKILLELCNAMNCELIIDIQPKENIQ